MGKILLLRLFAVLIIVVVVNRTSASAIDPAIPENGSISLKAYPNPFVSDLIITFSLEEDEELKLGVYNLLGQQIREIIQGEHSAGDSRFTWDGKDNSGKPVPAGMYYIIFVKGEEKQVLKILKSR